MGFYIYSMTASLIRQIYYRADLLLSRSVTKQIYYQIDLSSSLFATKSYQSYILCFFYWFMIMSDLVRTEMASSNHKTIPFLRYCRPDNCSFYYIKRGSGTYNSLKYLLFFVITDLLTVFIKQGFLADLPYF